MSHLQCENCFQWQEDTVRHLMTDAEGDLTEYLICSWCYDHLIEQRQNTPGVEPGSDLATPKWIDDNGIPRWSRREPRF